MGNACAPRNNNGRGDDSSRSYIKKKHNIENIHMEQLNAMVPTKYNDARTWENQFDTWMQGKSFKPESHPDPDHWWNNSSEQQALNKQKASKINKKYLEQREYAYRKKKKESAYRAL